MDSIEVEVEDEPIEVVEVNSLHSDASSRKRRTTSTIWEHFVAKEGRKCVCKYCGKLLVGGGRSGTHGLHGHLKTCPALKNKRTLVDGSGHSGAASCVFDETQSRRLLAQMIIKHEYPLSMVEHEGFRDFCTSLHPSFRVVSRNTVKKDILKIYEHEKDKTMAVLNANTSRIAITTDMWTSNHQKRGFMTITAHFINDKWMLDNRLLRFVYVPCPHNAEVLGTALMECLADWKIDDKLSALTVDNCTTNDAMVEDLLGNIPFSSHLLDGDLFHMRCSAHILNLIVRDGLEVISGSIEAIRGCVAYWSATPKREEKFMDTAKTITSKRTKLVLDCRTRWNSTYLMLQSAMKYKEVFFRLRREYKVVPTEEEWELTKVISEKLQVLYKITSLFSGSNYPTANLYFPNICDIKIGIDQWLTSERVEVRMMAERMSLKFNKYWEKIHGMMAIATILDPRFKMELIEFYFPQIYEDPEFEVERIRDLITSLTSQYQMRLRASLVSSQSSASPCVQPFDLDDEPLTSFDSYVSTKRKKERLTSELDDYLGEQLIPRNLPDFKILQWWKLHGVTYPTLQAMARDILAIPVTTIASESAFSASGRVVSSHRNRLHAETLEALMCSRDWMLSEMRVAANAKSTDTPTFDDDFDEDMNVNASLYY